MELDNIIAEAINVFGNREKADLWFEAPNQSLSGDTPRAHIVTEAGLQQVHDLIVRIKYGNYS